MNMSQSRLATIGIIAAMIGFVLLGCQKKPQKSPSADNKKNNQKKQAKKQVVAAKSPLQKSIQFLLKQQQDDGLWHSEYYGNLKSGSGISTLVLYAISQTDSKHWESNKKQLQKCVDVLSKNIRKSGFVSNQDGPDYSNYGSAYLLLSIRKLDLDFDAGLRNQLVKYLVKAQLDEPEGFKPESDNYGGWDLTGWMTGKRPTTGTNISVSCAVLTALHTERQHLLSKKPNLNAHETELLESIEKCFERARTWIERCQSKEGGFFFHPEQKHHGNKAGWFDEGASKAKPYGSASADGLICLQRLMPAKDSDEFMEWNSKIEKAKKWLSPYKESKKVPGFENEDADSSWALGLRFYFWMRLAQSEFGLKKSLVKHLGSLQKSDGRWENPNARMREDDPLIATSFALIALANAEADKK